MEERLYDLIFIARPATAEEDVKKVLAVIEHACREKGGKVEKAEHLGHAQAGLSRGQAPRRHVLLPADSHFASAI